MCLSVTFPCEILVHDCPWQSPITSPRYLVQRIAMHQPDILMQSDGGSFYKATMCSQLMECFWRYQLHQQISTNKMGKNLNTHLLKAQHPLRFFIFHPTKQVSQVNYPVTWTSRASLARCSNKGNSLLAEIISNTMTHLIWRSALQNNNTRKPQRR